MSAFLRVRPGPLGGDHAVDVLWGSGAVAIGEAVDDHGAYLDAGFDDDAALHRAAAALAGPHAVEVVADDESWWDGWREFAAPVRCGRVIVQPAWLAAADAPPDAVVVTIDPGRSFGSGAHVTTMLALEAMQSFDLAGCRVLDVGCGSGVLAIAAARLGAARVVAVDPSPDALAAAADNVARNDVGSTVTLTAEPVDSTIGSFDVVVANLPSPTIVDLAPVLVRCTGAGGALVVSGFLDARAAAVAAAAVPLAVVERHTRDGWSSMVLGRSPAGRKH